MRIRVTVSGYRELGRLAGRLRAAADGQLQRDAAAELQRAADPVVAQVRAKVQGASFPGIPSTGSGRGGGTGLRARLAAATVTEARADGVRIKVEGSIVGPRGHRLAMLTDTELAPRWRHPVHGNPEKWVGQQGQPWFFSTIRPAAPQFRAGVERAMEKTARRIEG